MILKKDLLRILKSSKLSIIATNLDIIYSNISNANPESDYITLKSVFDFCFSHIKNPIIEPILKHIAQILDDRNFIFFQDYLEYSTINCYLIEHFEIQTFMDCVFTDLNLKKWQRLFIYDSYEKEEEIDIALLSEDVNELMGKTTSITLKEKQMLRDSIKNKMIKYFNYESNLTENLQFLKKILKENVSNFINTTDFKLIFEEIFQQKFEKNEIREFFKTFERTDKEQSVNQISKHDLKLFVKNKIVKHPLSNFLNIEGIEINKLTIEEIKNEIRLKIKSKGVENFLVDYYQEIIIPEEMASIADLKNKFKMILDLDDSALLYNKEFS